MLSTSQLFELSTRTKSTLKQSGKLIGSGVGLGLSGVGKVVDQAGRSLYNKLNNKTDSQTVKQEDSKDPVESKK